MTSGSALLVFAIASFWTLPGASCHNNLRLAVSNGTSTYSLKINLRTPEFSKFYLCVCGHGLKQTSCTARLGNLNIFVNHESSFVYQQMGMPKCTEVIKRAEMIEVRINYAMRNVHCTGYSAGRYVYVGGGDERCSSNCAAFVTHEIPLLLQGNRDVMLNGRLCNTPCCENVLGIATTATKTPTTRVITTETVSYLNATIPFKNHSHMHGNDVTVLVLSVVTALLAVAAIIISLVVFWRHNVRKKATITALFRDRHHAGQEDSHAEQPSNVYSYLSRNNAGSFHGYADLTRGNVELVGLARTGSNAGNSNVDNKSQARFPIYDDINDNDTGYLEVTDN